MRYLGLLQTPVIIVADDLTGACDAAVHFAAAGLRTEVSLDGSVPQAEVSAFSTDTRDSADETIRSRISAVASACRPALVFKKIDSLLRGRPGFEISIAMEAFGLETAVITPAFPEMGRFVIGGQTVGVDVRSKLHADGLDTERCQILDAQTNADLDEIVQANTSQHKVLWCGSGGLAMALAKHLSKGAHIHPRKPNYGSVTFCIGSTHAATTTQVRELPSSTNVIPVDRNATTAEEIRAMLAGPTPAALFACGGDTATMILGALGTTSITLIGEIVRGVPWGIMRGGIMDGVPVVTKSGGFGAPDTLIRVAAFFNQHE